MSQFERSVLQVNGVETVVLTAGRGDALVYFHGAGTATRFDFAAPWTQRFKVVIPFHPGFGESADDPSFTEIHDYVLHYLDLFDALGLQRIRLVGHSMGGFIATKLAVEHSALLEKLVLACPIGIPVPPEHPPYDFLKAKPEELPGLLAADPQMVLKHLPRAPDAAFGAERGKEAATAERVLGRGGFFDPKLPRWLHRIDVPIMLVWGTRDRMTPAVQHRSWQQALPKPVVKLYENAGHIVLDEAPESVADIAAFFAS